MKRWLGGMLVMACSLAPGVALAGPWTSLVAFGDSLSDNGNATLLTGGFFPGTPSSRFSNGPVAVEYLAQRIGVPLAPSVAGGTDYAVGGATTGTVNFNVEIDNPAGLQSFPGVDPTGILLQVGAFLGSGTAFDPATSLFTIWGGPNDLFLALAEGMTDPLDLGAVAGRAVQNLGAAVVGLAGGGARHFIVPNMANLGRTPRFAGTPAEPGLEALSIGFNAGLASTMTQIEDALGVEIILVDIFSTLDLIIGNPQAFGFTNATTGCLDSPADVLAGCPGFVFFDGVHPTTAAHFLISELFAQAIPVPSSLALLLAGAGGLLVAAGYRRRPRPLPQPPPARPAIAADHQPG